MTESTEETQPVEVGKENALSNILLQGVKHSLEQFTKWNTELTAADYEEETKTSLDIENQYVREIMGHNQFEFKNYAPHVFEDLRREGFDAKSARFRQSLCGSKSKLLALGTLGRSGSILFQSQDRRFIVKTVSRTEGRFLLSILKDYQKYIRAHPHSLISRIYGLWRLNFSSKTGNHKYRFMAMNCVFAPCSTPVSLLYDLKGSWVKRKAREGAPVFKDEDLLEQERVFRVRPDIREQLLNQLQDDVEFLASLNIMDYSLLVGVIDGALPQKRSTTGPSLNEFGQLAGHARAGAKKRYTIANLQPVNLDVEKDPGRERGRTVDDIDLLQLASDKLDVDIIAMASVPPDSPLSNRGKSELEQLKPEEGKQEKDSDSSVAYQKTESISREHDESYLLGLIDFLQPYEFKQRAARVAKTSFLCRDWNGISTVPPINYQLRFMDAMRRYFVEK